MEKDATWEVIVHGEAEGREALVAIDFQDAASILAPREISIGTSFIDRLLGLIRLYEHWIVKTVIEEVRTPQGDSIDHASPLFAILSKSHPRGLSAGALFIGEVGFTDTEEDSTNGARTGSRELFLNTQRFSLVGISPVAFSAACSEDSKLFSRFISRLLNRPDAFSEVSLLLPRDVYSVPS